MFPPPHGINEKTWHLAHCGYLVATTLSGSSTRSSTPWTRGAATFIAATQDHNVPFHTLVHNLVRESLPHLNEHRESIIGRICKETEMPFITWIRDLVFKEQRIQPEEHLCVCGCCMVEISRNDDAMIVCDYTKRRVGVGEKVWRCGSDVHALGFHICESALTSKNQTNMLIHLEYLITAVLEWADEWSSEERMMLMQIQTTLCRALEDYVLAASEGLNMSHYIGTPHMHQFARILHTSRDWVKAVKEWEWNIIDRLKQLVTFYEYIQSITTVETDQELDTLIQFMEQTNRELACSDAFNQLCDLMIRARIAVRIVAVVVFYRENQPSPAMDLLRKSDISDAITVHTSDGTTYPVLPHFTFGNVTHHIRDALAEFRNRPSTEAVARIESKWATVNADVATSCSICLEQFQPADQMTKLACQHSFHNECIRQWLMQSVENSCPICRNPIN